MIRIVLADDEPLALRGLERLLSGIHDVEIVGTASDGHSALALIRETNPDLAFLDIRMPGMSGMEVAAALAERSAPDVVFVTAFDGHAIDAFALDAVDYLLKPVQPDRLQHSLQRARRRRSAGRDPFTAGPARDPLTLHIPGRHGGREVPQADIIWIEAAKDYGLVHTEQRSFMLRTTMAELAARLSPSIIRVHRSAYVRLDVVQRMEVDEKGNINLVLPDEVRIGVGPSYTKTVRSALNSRAPRSWKF